MAKDAKGHGSDKGGGVVLGGQARAWQAMNARGMFDRQRGGMAKVSVDPSKLGFRIADIGPGGVEHNVKTGGAWNADHEAAHQLARANPKAIIPDVHPAQRGSMRGGISAMRANSQRRRDRKGKGYSL